MKVIKKISTPMADVELREDGLYYLEVTADDTTMEVAKEHIRMLREEFDAGANNPMKTLVILKNMKSGGSGGKEVRDYFAKPENADINAANAYIISSPIGKIAINLFIKFSRPPFPTKVFSNIEKAREWLLSLP